MVAADVAWRQISIQTKMACGARNPSRNGENELTFQVDDAGNMLNRNPAAVENYRKCLAGEYDVRDMGIIPLDWTDTEPGEIECIDCGRPVTMYNAFTITCECGADYNSAGMRLAPRSQWGEETGEHWTDCY